MFGVLDYYKRDEILLSDTKFGEDRDYRGEDGGRNFQSLTAGGTWNNVTGTTAAGTPLVGNYAPRDLANAARLAAVSLDFNGAVAAGLINLGLNAATGQPNPPPPLGGAGATNLNQPGNTWCAIDIHNQLWAIPGTERIGFLGRGMFDFTPRVQGFGEFAYSNTETEQTFTKPVFITTALEPTPAGLQPFNYNIIYGPGVAGNPFGTNATFTGNLQGLGTRDTQDRVRHVSGAWRACGTASEPGISRARRVGRRTKSRAWHQPRLRRTASAPPSTFRPRCSPQRRYPPARRTTWTCR